ncbi:MAG: PD40 domain-containing protein [Acidobacteria bacterium]|nr:PD40 domain-containing protein [Acidobacteriota bacterium]
MKRVVLILVSLGAMLTPSRSLAGESGSRTGAVPSPLLARALAGPMSGVEEIVFAARLAGSPSKDGHWYANFGYYGPDAGRKAYGEGGRLYKLNLKTGALTALIDDPKGGVRDPQVHYDGTRILFSYRKGGTANYHLYEINIDGSGLRQLTRGPFDDIEPTYLPNGDLYFVSSRCRRWVNCWLTQVAVLYRANGDGGEIRPVSSNNEQDNTPWPLPDGRVLYTRWEYVDRSQVHYHHLWSCNPDGTNQTVYYGNLHPGIVMIDSKPVPNSHKVVSIFSPGHGRREHEGAITVVDPRAGPDNLSFARRVTKAQNFRDPWAFSEESFLAASGASLVYVTGDGAVEKIFTLPAADLAANLQLHEPRPVTRRPRERLIPPRVNLAKETGALILADVHQGRNMAGVRPGEIKKLLVLETLPMPIHYTGGMEPISYGGTFTLERIAGTVPVEADGSAYFELPALRSFFFVALDKDDLAVKRMQSFVTVQPGETTSCVGCHEDRVKAPAPGGTLLLAARRGPSAIEPIRDVPDVFDFPRDIQPILDRHCLKCHDYGQRKGGVILSGDRGPMYSHSYFTLTVRNQVADGRNRPQSNYPPRALGSSASPLMQKLTPAHHGVETTAYERKMVRLWIETGGAYPGTYAALGTGMIGHYTENQLDRQDLKWSTTSGSIDAVQRRCGSCHGKDMPLPLSASDDQKLPPWQGLNLADLRRRYSRHLVYNLTRPEQSMMLLAPLSRAAGGYELCRTAVFSDASDADYRKILAYITEAKDGLEQMKRFDMPGFRPRVDWVREMKRFGILPFDHDPSQAVDYYAAERSYWESLWYRPQ